MGNQFKNEQDDNEKDIMKQNIKIKFLEDEYNKLTEEISSLKSSLHVKISENLKLQEDLFNKEQDNEKSNDKDMNIDNLNESIEEIRANNNKLIIKSNMLNKLISSK